MKIEVLVKPRSSREKVEETGVNQYTVWVHEPPIENKANLAVIALLARHLNVSKSQISLFKGSKGKHKVFEVI